MSTVVAETTAPETAAGEVVASPAISTDHNAEKAGITNYSQVGEDQHDPFNGIVAVFEDHDIEGEQRYWVEHQRKDIYTDYLTLEEAKEKAELFVNDTIF